MKKVALFGGRFDPVHNGHLAVAREILKVNLADEIWFMPDNQHQWNPIVAPTQDRMTMLQLAIADEKNMLVNDTAIKIGGMTETITVIRELRKQFTYDFIFVCGSDQLSSLHKWTHWKELEKELPFLIVARKGYPIMNVPENATCLDDPNYHPLEDSATRIREYSKEGKSINGLLPKEVAIYIAEKKLYM